MPAPKGRWFWFGEPWGVFAKTNPAATRKSVIRHTVGWALVGMVIFAALVYAGRWSAEYWPAKAIVMAIFFGFIGGLTEWQVDDSD
jgi:hypothetical protein